MRFSKYTWAAAVVVAMAVTACGGGGGDDTTRVAKDDVAAPVTATTVKALSGPTFNFANGIPALGTTGPTQLKITAPAGASTIPTFVLDSGSGTANGTMTFGSCIFNVTASTIPGLNPGASVTVQQCELNIDTDGDPVGQARGQAVTLVLNGVGSDPITLTVLIDENGKVTVTTIDGVAVDVGTVITVEVTGA